MKPLKGWGKRPAGTTTGPNRKGPRVFRVGEVNRAAKEHIESKFSDFWVEGELSEVKRSRNGHVYFTLSDEREKARLSGILFERDLRTVRAELEDGERVRVRGNLTLHVASGRYQIRARTILPAGAGDLAAQFDRIRKRLAAEGLLDAERKRELPRLPRAIGVVTSAQSAALRDIVRVAHARAPVRLIVADCQVMGEGSARSIVVALDHIQKIPEVDVIILGRGGGSAEELWSFNAERVARAVASARVPVVCGVGHETDVTIAELVADRRASTPSNAAEIAVPDAQVLLGELEGLRARLDRAIHKSIDRSRLDVHELERTLTDPRRMIAPLRRRVRELEERLRARDPRVTLAKDRRELNELQTRLERAAQDVITEARSSLGRDQERLEAMAPRIGKDRRQRLARLAAQLDALSPLRVLERGYAIAFDDNQQAIKRAEDVEAGDIIKVRLHEGTLRARVEEE